MKKMLVLALVLAVAGIVNAGISFAPVAGKTFTVNGTGTPDEAWLSIVGPLAFDFASFSLGSAAGTGAAFVADASYAPEYLYFKNVAVPAPGSWVDGKLFSVNITGADTLVGGSWKSENNANALAQVKLYGPDGVTVVETMSYVVPEPMTMGLLALGALFLRKK